MNEASKNPAVKKYLRRLEAALGHLSPADRKDIVREIEGHIIERWEADSKGAFDDQSLHGVFGKLGEPTDIAVQYCEQRGWAKPPRKHTLRNALLATAAVLVFVTATASYVGVVYLVLPLKDMLQGTLLRIDETGIRFLNGAFSITDDGIEIGGRLNINPTDASDEKEGTGVWELLSRKAVAEESEVLKIPAGRAENLDLDIKNAIITVEGADADAVEINYTKRAYGSSEARGREALSGMGLSHSLDNSVLSITGRAPSAYPGGIYAIVHDVAMKVPARLSVEISSNNSSIDLSAIKGSVGIEGQNGQADLADISGDVNLDMKRSSIRARNIGGNASIEAKYGSADVEGIGKDLSVDGKYGSITARGVGGNLRADTKYGQMKIMGVDGDIQSDSKYGQVEITLAEAYGFRFVGESKYGAVDCDFPTQRQGENVTATVGDGSHEVAVSTKYGAIKVRRENH